MALQRIDKLVWIDLEMTGLDVIKDKIIQIAVIITDTDLKMLGKGKVWCIKINKEDIELMEDKVKDMHMENNLIYKCLKSKLTLKKVEERVIKYISQYVNSKESPLCGDNIATDKMFIVKNMPHLAEYLHYRNIDISTIRQLGLLWAGIKSKISIHKNALKHDALTDIRVSIRNARFFKKEIFDKVAKD